MRRISTMCFSICFAIGLAAIPTLAQDKPATPPKPAPAAQDKPAAPAKATKPATAPTDAGATADGSLPHKACEDLKTEISKKLDDKGVQKYTLTIVDATDVKTEDKVVGSCDGGTKRITYKRD
jgi:hypothetical protein